MKITKMHALFFVFALVALMFLPFHTMAAEIEKTETVYAELNSDGSVKNVMVVNHINTPRAGTYVDFGTYSSINNITGQEKPFIDGEKITWELPNYENGFYYIGTMNQSALPWDLSITYRLDGKTVEAKELAGKTGQVEIHLKATPNSESLPYFQDNFAMQLTQTLNTDLCTDIHADGATSVIAGKSDSLAYTVLPGKPLDATIIFQAEDLEMSGFSVILSPFSMSSFSSLSNMTGKVDQMYDAMDQMIDGNRQLQTGFQDILVAIKAIQNGTGALSQNTETISGGFLDYAQGLNMFSEYINVFASEMENSMGALKESTKEIEAAQQALTQSSQRIQKILGQFDQEIGVFQGQISQLEAALTELNAGLSKLSQSLGELKTANDSMGSKLNEINSQYDSLQSKYAEITAILQEYLGNSDLANELKNHEDPKVRALAETYLRNQSGISIAVSTLETLNTNFQTLNVSFHSGMKGMETGYQEISNGIGAMQSSINEILKGMGEGFDFSPIKNQLSSLEKELDQAKSILGQFRLDDISLNFEAFIQGIQGMQSAAGDLKTGFGKIQTGMKARLFPGISQLHQGATTLYNNIDTFPAGLQRLLTGQIALKNGVGDALAMLDIDENDETKDVSFASDQGSASSVQFIMSTPAIAVDSTVYTAPQKEKTSFWQRIKDLFS
ncbi:MAG: hypothetical protein U0M15_07340 [Bacillota bacterium]|nr:hypothetical protein [Bacillota bacterium]